MGRYEPFWALMLKWRWALGAKNKCAEKDKADDRWQTAYDGSSLNRSDEIEKTFHWASRYGQIVQATLPELLAIKGFRNIHGIVTVHRFPRLWRGSSTDIQGSRLRTKKGLKNLCSLHSFLSPGDLPIDPLPFLFMSKSKPYINNMYIN